MAKQKFRQYAAPPDLFITRPLPEPANTELAATIDHIERALNGRVFMYPMAEMCIELFRLSAVSEVREAIVTGELKPHELEHTLRLTHEEVQPKVCSTDERLFCDDQGRLCLSLDDTDKITDYYVNVAVRHVEQAFGTRIMPEHRGYIPHALYGDKHAGAVKDYIVVGEVAEESYPGDYIDRRALLADPLLYLEMDDVDVVFPQTVTLGAMTIVSRQRSHLNRVRDRIKHELYIP